jgi:hypothetical protein
MFSRRPASRHNRGRIPTITKLTAPSSVIAVLGSAAWYVDAALGITIGTGVSAWADQSGNGRNFTQATGSLQPLLIASAINGQPSVKADGVDDFLQNSFARVAPGTTPFYMWFLMRQNTWTFPRALYGDGGSTLQENATTPGITAFNGTTGPQNNGLTVGSFKLVEVQYRNSTADYLSIGSVSVTGTNLGNQPGSGGKVGLFASATGTTPSDLEICECGCFLGIPSSGQRSQIASYMSNRYGASVLT